MAEHDRDRFGVVSTSGWDRWRSLDRRTPVIVGIAAVDQHVDEPGGGHGPIPLMVDAALAAGADSEAPALLAAIDLVAVPEGSWRYRDPGRLVAQGIGAGRARTLLTTAGIPQQTLLDLAYEDLLAGRAEVALVVGGEAARRAALAKRADVELDDAIAGDDTDPDDLRRPDGEMITPAEIAVAAYAPAQQFAIIDSALRAAEGRTVEEHCNEVAELMAGFNRIAGGFAHAAFGEPRSADWIREPSRENRPIAFPYNKWHCSQMNVDQACALLVTTLAAAEQADVDPSKVVFPLVALESSFTMPMPRRTMLARWPAMEVLGAAAAEHLGAPLDEVEHVELYSCFPAAVRVQQRALGIMDRVPTITGGEPFAGGPWNNYVLQSTVAMIELLRSRPGERGLVTSVSGFMNKPALAVYSTEPAERGLLVADLADRAEAATPTVPVVESHVGPATIVGCTVAFERDGSRRTIVVADIPDGSRCLAATSDPQVADAAMSRELVGTPIEVDGNAVTRLGTS